MTSSTMVSMMLKCCFIAFTLISISESVNVISDDDIPQTYREKLESEAETIMPESVKQRKRPGGLIGSLGPPRCFYLLHRKVTITYLCYWVICPFRRPRKIWFSYISSDRFVFGSGGSRAPTFAAASRGAAGLGGSGNVRSINGDDSTGSCFTRGADKCSGASDSCFNDAARGCKGNIGSAPPGV